MKCFLFCNNNKKQTKLVTCQFITNKVNTLVCTTTLIHLIYMYIMYKYVHTFMTHIHIYHQYKSFLFLFEYVNNALIFKWLTRIKYKQNITLFLIKKKKKKHSLKQKIQYVFYHHGKLFLMWYPLKQNLLWNFKLWSNFSM